LAVDEIPNPMLKKKIKKSPSKKSFGAKTVFSVAKTNFTGVRKVGKFLDNY